jgi:hypothetical protein
MGLRGLRVATSAPTSAGAEKRVNPDRPGSIYVPRRGNPVEHDPSGDQGETPDRKPARSETQSYPHRLIVPHGRSTGHSAGTDLLSFEQ